MLFFLTEKYILFTAFQGSTQRTSRGNTPKTYAEEVHTHIPLNISLHVLGRIFSVRIFVEFFFFRGENVSIVDARIAIIHIF